VLQTGDKEQYAHDVALRHKDSVLDAAELPAPG
jgi:hypothetical protein